jgi:hypothetical protein
LSLFTQRPSTLSDVEVRSKVVGVKVEEWEYPRQGYLEVYVYFSGEEVAATVTIVDSATGETVGTYVAPQDFPVLLDTGTYMGYVYYENYRSSQIIEIREGQTTVWRVYMEPRRVCFVATACYGYGHPRLETFRWFRDAVLLKTVSGRFFVKVYYYYIGRPVARVLELNRVLKTVARKSLDLIGKFLESVKR